MYSNYFYKSSPFSSKNEFYRHDYSSGVILTGESVDPLGQVGGVHGGVFALLHPLAVVVVVVVVDVGVRHQLLWWSATNSRPCRLLCKKHK